MFRLNWGQYIKVDLGMYTTNSISGGKGGIFQVF